MSKINIQSIREKPIEVEENKVVELPEIVEKVEEPINLTCDLDITENEKPIIPFRRCVVPNRPQKKVNKISTGMWLFGGGIVLTLLTLMK